MTDDRKQKAEVRRQRTDDRKQMIKDERQKSEVRGQRTEDRGL